LRQITLNKNNKNGGDVATQDVPDNCVPKKCNGSGVADTPLPKRSRIEEALVKSSLWKKQTLRDIEQKRARAASTANEPDPETARLLTRLSAQLEERNDEISRLRRVLSKLRDEKSMLDRAHRRELERRQAELTSLQDAYHQFEKEADSLLSELSRQNERLRKECRPDSA
jgi:chromosome segregation ATPase